MTTSEIFAANKVLTVAVAKELKGKKIACTSPEYKYNTPTVSEFVVGEIISEWDDAANREYPDQKGKYTQYDNYQQYWASYMSETQINKTKDILLLLDAEGNRHFVAHVKYDNYYKEPTFTGSDADREVYYVEVNEN